jgi:hypothetical protein
MKIRTAALLLALALWQDPAFAATNAWARDFDVEISQLATLPLEVYDSHNVVVGAFVRSTPDLQGAVVVNSDGFSFAIQGSSAQLYPNSVFPLDGFEADTLQPFRAIGYLLPNCAGQAYLLRPHAGYVVRTTVAVGNYQVVFTPLGELPQVRTFRSVLTDGNEQCGNLGDVEQYTSASVYPNSEFVTGYSLTGYLPPLGIRVVSEIFADGFEQSPP